MLSLLIQPYAKMEMCFGTMYDETCLSRTMDKTKSSITHLLNEFPLFQIFVN